MKKKIILSSVLTIALCLSLIAGSTFALFTSTSEVNVAVTAGKVEVVATLEDLATYSMGQATDVNGTFENGGTASFTDAKELVLSNATPGDKVTFNVKVANESNVAASYRIKMTAIGELADGLVGKAGENGENTVPYTTLWTSIDMNAEFEIPVSIELPKDAGNEYQGKNAKVLITVEAVQRNATNVAWIGDTYYESLEDAMAAAQAGDTIQLGYGDYEMPSGALSNLTFRGYGDATTFRDSGNVLYYQTLANVTFRDVAFVGGLDSVRMCIASGTVTFDGCSFMNAQYGIHFDSGNTTNDLIVIKNCEIYGWNSFGGSVEKVEISDSHFYGNGSYGVLRPYQDTVVTNCTFDFSNASATMGIVPGAGQTKLIGCTNVNGAIEDLCDENQIANGTVVIQ